MQIPRRESKIGNIIRNHPRNNAHPGRSKGLSNSAMKAPINATVPKTKVIVIVVHLIKQGKFSPVFSFMSLSSFLMSKIKQIITISDTKEKSKGKPTE